MANISITVNEADNLFLTVERLKIMTVSEIQGTASDERNSFSSNAWQDIAEINTTWQNI